MCGVPKGAYDAHCNGPKQAGAAGGAAGLPDVPKVQQKPRDYNAEDVMDGLRAQPKKKVEAPTPGALDSVKDAIGSMINAVKRALPTAAKPPVSSVN